MAVLTFSKPSKNMRKRKYMYILGRNMLRRSTQLLRSSELGRSKERILFFSAVSLSRHRKRYKICTFRDESAKIAIEKSWFSWKISFSLFVCIRFLYIQYPLRNDGNGPKSHLNTPTGSISAPIYHLWPAEIPGWRILTSEIPHRRDIPHRRYHDHVFWVTANAFWCYPMAIHTWESTLLVRNVIPITSDWKNQRFCTGSRCGGKLPLNALKKHV